jgi:hypothetical protein
MSDIAGSVRDDVHRQLRKELDQRLSAVEASLHLKVETAHEETVNAMVASIEARVTPRISRLESDVNNQSAAMTELRDCSLQSERSIQRLLGILERVVTPKTSPADATAEKRPASEPASQPDASKLTIMTSREPDEADSGSTMVRRPASFR